MGSVRDRVARLERHNGPGWKPIAIVVATEPDDDQVAEHGAIHQTEAGALTLSVVAERDADPMACLTREQRKALDAAEPDQTIIIRGRNRPDLA